MFEIWTNERTGGREVVGLVGGEMTDNKMTETNAIEKQ